VVVVRLAAVRVRARLDTEHGGDGNEDSDEQEDVDTLLRWEKVYGLCTELKEIVDHG